MDTLIPYGRHEITPEDIDAVVEVMKSDFLTQGPGIAAFEEAFAKYAGAQYAIAVSSGTAALHVAALSLGINPGDRVLVPAMTFAATANCVLYCGGEVEFVDTDPDTFLLDLGLLEKKLSVSKPGTYKGIIAVDMGGNPVQMDAVRRLADQYDCWVMEDAAHSPGGLVYGCKWPETVLWEWGTC